ncbi:MAG: hypothetical protein FRX49_12165 [Trebouxia sp. A1-2]|nr:MAG: hypothetical protein FRX49_12165 [Trebouxia sp. A1-2]
MSSTATDNLNIGSEFQSEWPTLPRDVLAKVLSERYTLCCLARQVCKAWRQHAFATPTAVDVTLASSQELVSLEAWMQHLNPNATVSGDMVEACLREGSSDALSKAAISQGQTRAVHGSAQANQTSPSAESPAPYQASSSKTQQVSEVKCSTQQLASLKLSAWSKWMVSIQDGTAIFRHSPELTTGLWQGLQRAQIHSLTLGEFFSDHFCDRLAYMKASQVLLPDKSSLPGLANLQALTLNLNLFGVQDMFRPSSINGGMHSLHELSQLTSLTLKLARPQLVNLDLTKSSCIFPPEAEAWSQLRKLHLDDSLVWLMNGQPFQFSALNQLTKLCLVDCSFGVHAPGQHGNTHHHVYHQMQAPISIVHLDICTKNVKGFVVREPLPALDFLALCNATQIMDAKSFLQNMHGLTLYYFTLNKSYHGEWWSHISALQTKCACNVSLGVAGVYPERLKRLFLTTECPEPVSVSTAQMTHQPKAYPHKAVPEPAAEEHSIASADQACDGSLPSTTRSGKAKKLQHQKGKGSGGSRPLLQPPVLCSVLPCLQKLELYITGSLKQLILTGLPKLQHLKVFQTLPRSPPKVTVRCKALKLPHSLRSFDLTISAPSLMIHQQLTVLHSLPRLETVGLHGSVLERIPDLRSTVTRLDLSNLRSGDERACDQLSRLTHLQELVLSRPLPADDPQAQMLQQHLKGHHVQLQYSDIDPFIPSSSGSCLHPTLYDSVGVPQAEDLELLQRQQAVLADDDMYGGMQAALLEDAAMHAAQMRHEQEAYLGSAWD